MNRRMKVGIVGSLVTALLLCIASLASKENVQASNQYTPNLMGNLVAYWSMTELNNVPRTDQVGSEDLTVHTLTGQLGHDAGHVGDGAIVLRHWPSTYQDYLYHADDSVLSTGNIDFTIAAWVYMVDKSSDRVIVSKWNKDTSNREYLLQYSAAPIDRWAFAVSSNGTTIGTVNSDNAGAGGTGGWYLVIGWHDSVNNVIGIQVQNVTPNTVSWTGGVLNGSADFSVGSRRDSIPGYFDGRIDEVGLWKKVLTQEERTTLWFFGAGCQYPLNSCPVPFPTNTPTKTPTPTPTATFVPPLGKGLAEDDPGHGAADRALLGVTKFYHWGEGCTDPNCINMVRNWNIGPTVPAQCYSIMLLGNEPTNSEPAGHPISASGAASATVALETKCPAMQIVAGNVNIGNWHPWQFSPDMQWIVDYLNAYHTLTGHNYASEGRNILGIHCYYQPLTYVDDPSDYCQHQITILLSNLNGIYGPGANNYPLWMTEFNVIYNGPSPAFQPLLDFFKNPANRISMVFPFTNRGPEGSPAYIDMVSSTGTLINNGPAYAAWQYP